MISTLDLEHIRECPNHPIAEYRAEIARLREVVQKYHEATRGMCGWCANRDVENFCISCNGHNWRPICGGEETDKPGVKPIAT